VGSSVLVEAAGKPRLGRSLALPRRGKQERARLESRLGQDGVAQAPTDGQPKVRYVGFTGHKDPAIHLKMLATGFPFDAVQMPLNAFDATFHSFETQVLPELNRRGIAALAHNHRLVSL
jgi:hypothetical protein